MPNPLVLRHWKPRQRNFLKINFDAGFNTRENKSCSGIVIRDGSGKVLCSQTKLHDKIPTLFAAEAMACFQAVKMGIQLGLSLVEIEGYSMAVIRKLHSHNIDRSVLGAYISNIKMICSRFSNCLFLHIPIPANIVAHSLATEGLKRNEETYLVGDVPPFAKAALESDGNQPSSSHNPTNDAMDLGEFHPDIIDG